VAALNDFGSLMTDGYAHLIGALVRSLSLAALITLVLSMFRASLNIFGSLKNYWLMSWSLFSPEAVSAAP
jgi:hypothetical protein